MGIALNALFDRFDEISVEYSAGVEFENPMQTTVQYPGRQRDGPGHR